MLSKTHKDLVFGLIVLAIGLAYLVMTMQLPRKAFIDSATVPYILAILITGLGVVQVVLAGKKLKSAPAAGAAAPAAASAGPDYRTVAITAVLITLYVVFLGYLGFPLLSSLYLFVQISILTPGYMRKNYLLYAFISILTSLAVYYIFLWAFDLMLPDGDLWYKLGWL